MKHQHQLSIFACYIVQAGLENSKQIADIFFIVKPTHCIVCIIHNNADKIEESAKLGAEVLSLSPSLPPPSLLSPQDYHIPVGMNHTKSYGYGLVHFYCIRNKYVV